MPKEPLKLTPNTKGEIIDHQCPDCGAWATEHEVLMTTVITPGVRTLKDMRELPPESIYGAMDILKCPR